MHPQNPDGLNDLGIALARQGRLAEAEEAFRAALRLRPNFSAACNNLGNLLRQRGNPGEAETSFREALRLDPDNADAFNNLATVLLDQGRLAETESCLRQALQRRPAFPEAACNLGTVLASQGKPEAALACYERARQLRPAYAEAQFLGALLLMQMGQGAQAAERFRQAVQLRPEFPEAHFHLREQQHYDASLACYEQAVRLRPDYADALNNLAWTCTEQGRLDEALVCYRRAMAVRPEDASLHSNFLLVSHYHPDYDPQASFREHLRWGARWVGTPPIQRPKRPDAGRTRRLRIGYVSADFRDHVMGRYSEAVIAAHDRGQLEVFCYANVSRPDECTMRIKAAADYWRPIFGLPDDEVAQRIVEDGIDLLIDLSGHTGGNRLAVFARKPAPIQATHFGYCDTTGLATMDYRLTDASCDPPGQTEHRHTETLVRLPQLFCYAPPAEAAEVGPLPADSAGAVTFGSFNNLC